MKRVIVLKEFVDVSNFNRRYTVGEEIDFDDNRAENLALRGLVSLPEEVKTPQAEEILPEEVKTLKQAKVFLRSKGIEFAQPIDFNGIIEIATKNNISFPNLATTKL